MTSKERVLRTLEFKGADRIPLDMWVLPGAKMEYGEKLTALQKRYDTDIVSFVGPFDHGFTPEYYQIGKYMDPWGSEWSNIQEGVIGEVKNPVFSDYEKLSGYTAPTKLFLEQWEQEEADIALKIAEARQAGKFILGGWISIFERLQYLRGTEDLYCDIALEESEMFELMELVMGFMREYVAAWLKMDIDGVAFGDDWGTQISLLIAPEAWVRLFKPLYAELIQTIRAAGKKVFFHSDGYIMELYPHFIEMGVDAINSQLWCMGVEKVAEQYAGKITFWGEISRQTTLPHGTPTEVRAAAKTMIGHLHVNGGGLIGQSEINRDVPLSNVEAFCCAWNEEVPG